MKRKTDWKKLAAKLAAGAPMYAPKVPSYGAGRPRSKGPKQKFKL